MARKAYGYAFIESLNSVRYAIKKRKTHGRLSEKGCLASNLGRLTEMYDAAVEWRMVMSRFIIELGDRFDGHF